MLITGTPSALEEVAREDLHVAGQHHQVARARRAARAARSSASGLVAARDGHVVEGDAERRRRRLAGPSGSRPRARSSPSSSPRRQRQSSSSRQCSSRETRIATRLRLRRRRQRHSIAKPLADRARRTRRPQLLAPAVSASGSNSMRMKKRPPSGSSECWSEETMFAPCAKRKPDTAATMPGRSGQEISRRAQLAPADPWTLLIRHRLGR